MMCLGIDEKAARELFVEYLKPSSLESWRAEIGTEQSERSNYAAWLLDEITAIQADPKTQCASMDELIDLCLLKMAYCDSTNERIKWAQLLSAAHKLRNAALSPILETAKKHRDALQDGRDARWKSPWEKRFEYLETHSHLSTKNLIPAYRQEFNLGLRTAYSDLRRFRKAKQQEPFPANRKITLSTTQYKGRKLTKYFLVPSVLAAPE